MRNTFKKLPALFFGLCAAIITVLPVTSHAQTVSNTAQIQWDVGSSRIVRNSNRIDIAVERTPITPSAFSLFHFSGNPTAQSLSIPVTMCRGSSGERAITLDGAFANTNQSPAAVVPATQIRAGEPLIVSLSSPRDNLDPNAIDTKSVRLETPAGDSELIILSESAANSGIFIGVIRTAAIPPSPIRGDCVLSVRPGEVLNLSGLDGQSGNSIASMPVDILIDPFGVIFDSGDATPVAGTRVTLINVATGQPAQVFGDDGVSAYPSTVVAGTRVTDSSGTIYDFPAGEYRFPFARPGTYRLLIETPAPYTAPSRVTPAEIQAAGLTRPGGEPFALTSASYGAPFTLTDPQPVRIDVPVDRPGGALILTKTASVQQAAPGDLVQYRVTISNSDATRQSGAITLTDILPDAFRLRVDTIRYNGAVIPYTVSDRAKRLTINVPRLAASASGVITYILEVRSDARAGTALNRAQAADDRGAQSPVVDAAVKIVREAIADRITIIGRVTDGGCTIDPDSANGIPNVRVILEDGSYAVTDNEGRYHFEGVLPGIHVVQFDPSTLPSGQVPADCTRNARSAGSAISRFVDAQGGALVRVDFRSQTGQNTARVEAERVRRAPPPTDQAAAGADRDWLAGQRAGIEWLFPAPDHNPRTKAIRVAIKHFANQTVRLFVNGEPVNPLAFDGLRKDAWQSAAVSLWRSVELSDNDTQLRAEILDQNGAIVQTLNRTVHFANGALRAELVREKSILVADGVTRPVIALRMFDRSGAPTHHGVTGNFDVPAPYFPAVEADAQAAKTLAGIERGRPTWKVDGDEGIAYIELEPTTASGGLSITLPFRDQQTTRSQRIDLWLTPGKRPWTIVGFAAGTAGFNTLNAHDEALGAKGDHFYTDARVALYAKGRVKGKWLLTLAYDSDKRTDETRFGGVIDPTAYYTVYADRTERRYDAASTRRLYLKLERPQFYALFGDYETGLNDTQLTRYSRALNGVKAEYRSEHVAATAFAADTPFRHRRDELQGNGLSGPYALGARNILPNSERIVIEVRDRLRSNKIVESRALVRHIDYDIDYVAGTLRFREPILSRSSTLDPQFIVADYEVDGVGERVTNAGGRATWTNAKKTLIVGATAIHNEDDRARSNAGAIDVRYTPTTATEIRAEFGVSDASARPGQTGVTEGTSTAWLIEAEHHSGVFDILAYARELQSGYGVGQINGSETGTRKFGVDARARLLPNLTVAGSVYQEQYLDSIGRRQAGRVLAEYRGKALDLRAGVTLANDRLTDGRSANSSILQVGATKRFFEGRLELDAQTEIAIAKTESIDFPARHKFGLRYNVTDDVTIVGNYEIANGDAIKARTARVGVDVKPWVGGRIAASANQQTTDEYGPRSFAAFGFTQSLPVTKNLTVDFTFDGNKTINSADRARVLNPAQPIASGGFVGSGGVISEDFTAVTAGATYRTDRWAIAGRAEVRASETGDRYGITASALRQIGEGRAFGGSLSWFRANSKVGVTTDAKSLALSWAHRPDDSRFTLLDKLELRSDSVTGAVFGNLGPIGGAPLTVSGDVSSQRIINSFNANWSPTQKRKDGSYLGRSEISFFWGSRYVFDKLGNDKLSGWSNVFGADLRFDLSETFDIGAAGTLRQNASGRSYSYAGGPSLGIAPFKNGYVSLGYNVVGFEDRDFEDSRYTRSGPYVTLRLKFDQTSLAGLGLGRK
ncbi:MAG: hypothetical protein ACKVOJ_10520 [Sphingomonadaceae bacterium]